MKTAYIFLLKEHELYCRNCSAVSRHQLYTRNAIKDLTKVEATEKILSVCQYCNDVQILFAGDFRFFAPEYYGEDLCKILGKGRIVLGDWLYIPGDASPCKVQSRCRIGVQEQFNVLYEDGSEKVITQEIPNVAGRKALEGYKLLPFQLSTARIGDSVYHVQRQKCGRVVGKMHGAQEKIVVFLEDTAFLILTLKSARPACPESKTLAEFINNSLQSAELPAIDNMDVFVRQGIVFVSGTCRHILHRETIIRYLEMMDGVLAVVSYIQIHPVRRRKDEELKEQIQEKLFDIQGIIGINIDVQEGVVALNGFFEKEQALQEIYQKVAEVDGVMDIQMNIRRRSQSLFADMEKTRMVVQALKKNSTLAHAKISVYAEDGVIYLEGYVYSNLQKSTASFAAMWAGKNLNVVNNLKVEKPPQSDRQVHHW
jgi:osmotically-inducible protein OsmY